MEENNEDLEARLEHIVRRLESEDGVGALEKHIALCSQRVSSADAAVNTLLKGSILDNAETMRVRNELEECAEKVSEVARKCKSMRLGGACEHGADKGPKCANCGKKRKGPNVNEDEGAEMGDFWYRMLEKKKGMPRKKLDRFAMRLDVVTTGMNEVDAKVLDVRSEIESVRKKVGIVIARLRGAGKDGDFPKPKRRKVISVEDCEDGLSGGPVEEVEQRTRYFKMEYRSVQVHIGLATISLFIQDRNLNKAQSRELKSYLESKLPKGSRPRIFRVSTVAGLVPILELLLQKCFYTPKKKDEKGPKNDEAHNEGPPIKAELTKMLCVHDDGKVQSLDGELDLFSLPTCNDQKDPKIILRADFQLTPTKKNVQLKSIYEHLCSNRLNWAPSIDRDSCSIYKPLMNSLPSAGLSEVIDLSFQGVCMDDTHFEVLCMALSVGLKKLNHLDLSMNKIQNFGPLAFPISAFANLTSLSISHSTSTSINCKGLSEIFKALQTGQSCKTLERLDLSFLRLFRVGCNCDKSFDCGATYRDMAECCQSLGLFLQSALSLRTVSMDGCFSFASNIPCGVSSCSVLKNTRWIKKSIVDLAKSISTNGSLKEVSLRRCDFGHREAVEALCKALLCHQSIECVDMSHSQLVNQNTAIVPQTAKELYSVDQSALTALKIGSSSSMLSSGVLIWIKGGCTPINLVELDLSNCGLSSTEAKTLFSGLKGSSLKALNINGNEGLLSGPRMEFEVVLGWMRGMLQTLNFLERFHCAGVGTDRGWERFFSSLADATTTHLNPYSSLRILEVGTLCATREMPQANHSSISICSALGLLSDESTIRAMRIWNAHQFIVEFEDIEADGVCPPFFSSVWTQGVQEKRIDGYMWELGPNSCSAIDIRRP